MSDNNIGGMGFVVLRVTNGLFLFIHGLLKVIYFPPTGAMKFFESFGLPKQTAILLIMAEIVIGLTLVAGVKTRYAALGATVILLGATLPHAGNGFVFSNPGGGWEYPVFWALILFGLSLMAKEKVKENNA